jgi:hypothetical protein
MKFGRERHGGVQAHQFREARQAPAETPADRKEQTSIGRISRHVVAAEKRRLHPHDAGLAVEHGLVVEIRQHDESRRGGHRLVPRRRRVVRTHGGSLGARVDRDDL